MTVIVIIVMVQPGFYTALLAVFSDYGIDVNIRWQAVLYFKNGVDRSPPHKQ